MQSRKPSEHPSLVIGNKIKFFHYPNRPRCYFTLIEHNLKWLAFCPVIVPIFKDAKFNHTFKKKQIYARMYCYIIQLKIATDGEISCVIVIVVSITKLLNK